MSKPAAAGFSADDVRFMAEALRLAARGRYTAHPNPRVGCVLVKKGEVIGRGWHKRAGEPHAEVNAIADAGRQAKGSVAYVTLEPCAHEGKTPPCVNALIDAGIGAVVCAIRDPHPQVAGRGVEQLEAAGITVRVGLLVEEASLLNRGFLSRVGKGRPFVRLKTACSLDGATAMADGQSQWITGPESRADVQRLRAESGAILTGIGTILADDPSLTVRDSRYQARQPGQPMRVVIDSHLRMPASACMLDLPGETRIYSAQTRIKSGLKKSAAVIRHCPGVNGRVDLSAVLTDLGESEINDVLVEAGPTLAGSLLGAGLVDELVIYQAPHIMGSRTRGMFDTPAWTQLADRLELKVTDLRKLGRDLRITVSP